MYGQVVGRKTNARILLKVKKCILSTIYKRKLTKFEVLIDPTLRTLHVSLSEIKYPMCSGVSCTILGIYLEHFLVKGRCREMHKVYKFNKI